MENSRERKEKKMYDLKRFIKAQEGAFEIALSEVKSGVKCSHWMWYIFPQIRGLGYSYTSYKYGIEDINEAKEYMKNDYLKNNLLSICGALLELETSDARAVFGFPDDIKLKSSMTLFEIASPEYDVFQKVLDKYFNGQRDDKTIELLKK